MFKYYNSIDYTKAYYEIISIMLIIIKVHNVKIKCTCVTGFHSPSSKKVCSKASISLSKNNALIDPSSSILTLALCSVSRQKSCNNDSSCSLTNVSSYCVFIWNSLYLTASESCNPHVAAKSINLSALVRELPLSQVL